MKSLFLIFSLLTILNSSFSIEKKILNAVIKEPITPITEKYIKRIITIAEKENYDCVLFSIDTPGGLLETTKNIVELFLNTKIDTAVYVSPKGAMAGSAGVFITLSAKYAAMAPGCNIGAAHPVFIGDSDDKKDNENAKILLKKTESIATAFIESIAKNRNRNIDLAKKTVKESFSYTADFALSNQLINFIANDNLDLIKKIYGMDTEIKIIEVKKNWSEKLLTVLANPNIAYFLLILGFYGIIFEIIHPGTIFSGALGAIFLITGLFALQSLPINFAGIILMVIAFVLFILEVFITSYGLLTIGGIMSLILGSAMLFDSADPLFRVSTASIAVVVIVTLALVAGLVFIVSKTIKNKAISGTEGMIGAKGIALKDFVNGKGMVQVHGEMWSAVSKSDIKKDQEIEVLEIDGLKLILK